MKTLIENLSRDVQVLIPLRTPSYWALRLLAVLVIYALGVQMFLGLRADLVQQFVRPYFAAEILLLTMVLLTSSFASVLAMYPDAYQKPKWLVLPYITFFLLVGLVGLQLFLPVDAGSVILPPDAHGKECALCIACVALLPSVLIFVLLRKGATVRQLQAGSLAILAASSMGCLTLRLAEANDAIMHLVSWHYLPTLLVALLGACLGKWFLKW